jgi:hypothetical protein
MSAQIVPVADYQADESSTGRADAPPPGEVEALDAYSRTVTSVVERLAPSVASLRVLRTTRRGASPPAREAASF